MALRREFSLSDRAIDVISRRTADALSRRGSLLALGGLALAASVPASTVKGRKGKNRKKRRKTCQRQVAPCQAFFTAICFGDPDCEAEFFPCCEQLANCDSAGLLECFFFCGCDELNDLVTNAQQP